MQVLAGNFTFRTPQQSINALAPSAAYNLTSSRVSNSVDTLAPASSLSSNTLAPGPAVPGLGSYTLTATKRNRTEVTNLQGPQFTTQVCPLTAFRFLTNVCT